MATGLINNKYRVTRRIGGGSFGEIYMGAGPNNEKVKLCVTMERHQPTHFHMNYIAEIGRSKIRTRWDEVPTVEARV